MPRVMNDGCPLPVDVSTFTLISVTPGATPAYTASREAIDPATCVP